jgi:Flp pilus assembly protein TadD
MLIDTGKRVEGVQHLERAIELAPSQPDAVYDLGTVLLEDQDFGRAASRFQAALKIRPEWPEAHNNLGIALASQGRIADALTHFERAVQLKPDFADARANRDQARSVLRK